MAIKMQKKHDVAAPNLYTGRMAVGLAKNALVKFDGSGDIVVAGTGDTVLGLSVSKGEIPVTHDTGDTTYQGHVIPIKSDTRVLIEPVSAVTETAAKEDIGISCDISGTTTGAAVTLDSTDTANGDCTIVGYEKAEAGDTNIAYYVVVFNNTVF